MRNLLICVNIYKVKCTFTKRGLSKKDICANECVGKKGLALDINRPTWIFTFCSEFRNGGLKRIEISHLVLGVFTQSCWILKEGGNVFDLYNLLRGLADLRF